MTRTGRTGLDASSTPRSVAVVGASGNPEKWGHWLAAGALEGRDRRTVHLVNRRGGEPHGVRFLPGPDGLPDPPEHVVVAVPPRQVRPLVVQGLAAGARCFTVITSGGTSASSPPWSPRAGRGCSAPTARAWSTRRANCA
ncbi:CoA-binding protein [Streptomyces sp. Wb2n-11]|uniref:CoA-binding protein n=1 Tax=Streptomyces sp. Wb2n-11 TaxID=1030533 RepID=UPI0021003F71|nr:CoA-binding protein [Streptomyces sp. Wb2n-11]